MLFFVFLSLLAMFDLLVGALRLGAVPVFRSRSVALAEVNSVRRLRDQTFLSDCPGESLLGIEREALAVGDLRVLIPPLRRAPPASDPIAQLHGKNDGRRLRCNQPRMAQCSGMTPGPELRLCRPEWLLSQGSTICSGGRHSLMTISVRGKRRSLPRVDSAC